MPHRFLAYILQQQILISHQRVFLKCCESVFETSYISYVCSTNIYLPVDPRMQEQIHLNVFYICMSVFVRLMSQPYRAGCDIVTLVMVSQRSYDVTKTGPPTDISDPPSEMVVVTAAAGLQLL